MNKLLLLLFFASNLLVFPLLRANLYAQPKYTDPSIQKDPTGYKLRSGDSVRIIVQGESDATISMVQAESVLVNQYKQQEIYSKPVVKVFVTKYTEQVVFLAGSVVKKGPYIFPAEVQAMGIVEVIARAGGFTDIAKKNNVYVTRTYYDNSGKATNTKTYEVNVEALNKGTLSSDSPQRFWIYPGDRIQVPERLF
jgi:protein involved in polysaccharide export with SLBB domain